jgi:3-keto-disaccharide hydrolase
LVGICPPLGSGKTLTSKDTFENFHLRFQAKGGLGHVRFRREEKGSATGVAISNGLLEDFLGAGDLFGFNALQDMRRKAPRDLVNKVLKKDDFNDYSIKCVGKHLTVQVNGVTTVDEDFAMIPRKGHLDWIVVGSSGTAEIHFRNIEIRTLPAVIASSVPAYQPLFNGKDLTGWTGTSDTYFVKKDGSLQANPVANEYAMLHTIKSYENYELRMLCKVAGAGQASAKNRGGVALHVTHPEGLTNPAYGIGISLTSGRDPDMKAHGLGDTGEVKSSQATKGPIGGPGSWNELRVICQDKKVTIYYNGEERWSCTLAPVSKGQIGLWSIDGETYFRDIEIKELPTKEPAFKTLFDGKDVSAWDLKLADNWRFEDNRLICRGAGGMLRPKKLDLREFHLRIEARYFGEGAYLRLGPQLFQTPDKKSVTAHQHVLLSPVLVNAAGSIGMEFGDKDLTGGVAHIDLTKPGEWYTLDVIHEGRYVRTLINGKPAAEFVVTEPGALVGLGLLGFNQEDKNGELQIRKIEIRDLSDDPKTAKKRLQGFWTPAEAIRDAVGKAAAFSKDDLKAFALEFDKDKLKCGMFPDATFQLRAPNRITIKYRNPAKQMVSAEATYRLTHDILSLDFENIDVPFGPAAPKDKDGRKPLQFALFRYHAELVPLFNGKNLHGFVNDRERWAWRDDTLVGVRRAGDNNEDLLFRPTMPNLRDFELEFQVRTQGQAPVGVLFRGGENKENVGLLANGPMLSIGGITPGGLWNRNRDQLWKVPPAEKIKAVKPDAFNHYVLRCVGKRVTVQINGVTMIDDDLDVPQMQPAGKLAWALLDNGKAGTVTFRAIRLRVLPPP